jgi:membrane dipeptidase
MGIRVIQLTYNNRNLLGDGCAERAKSGLSYLGVEAVKRMNDMGILVDVSHCSDQTALDAIEVAERPTAITHAFCSSISGHERGKSDDVIRAIGDSGGYFGVCVVPFFITSDQRPTLEHWLEHFDRVVQLAGVAHVGIGTDWGEDMPRALVSVINAQFRAMGFRADHGVDFGATVNGFQSWPDWPNLTAALIGRGYSDEEVRGFLGANFRRTFEQATD